MPKVEVSGRSARRRCPFCHESLAEGPRMRCSACDTDYHQDCLEELGRCGTLGCSKPIERPDGKPGVKRCRVCGDRMWNPVGLAHLFPCEPTFPHFAGIVAGVLLFVGLFLVVLSGAAPHGLAELLELPLLVVGVGWLIAYLPAKGVQEAVLRRRRGGD